MPLHAPTVTGATTVAPVSGLYFASPTTAGWTGGWIYLNVGMTTTLTTGTAFTTPNITTTTPIVNSTNGTVTPQTYDRAPTRTESPNARAEKLLFVLLSDEQRAMYQRHRYVVETAPSGHIYRLEPVQSGGIRLLDTEVHDSYPTAVLCAHPRGSMPGADVLVAQLLMIRAGNEAALLAKANVHRGTLPITARRMVEDYRLQVAQAQEAARRERHGDPSLLHIAA